MTALVKRWSFGDPITEVSSVLAAGGIVAIPTESSYGLAVDPRSQEAVERVYAVKRRDGRKPLPLVIADRTQADAVGVDTDHPLFLWAERHWPAPLTVIVPLRAGHSGRHALGALEAVAVRMPEHPQLLELLGGLEHALTATSANLSGEPALVTADETYRLLNMALGTVGADSGSEDARAPGLVIDGPPLPGGAPSTMVAWREGSPVVVRPGRFEMPTDGNIFDQSAG